MRKYKLHASPVKIIVNFERNITKAHVSVMEINIFEKHFLYIVYLTENNQFKKELGTSTSKILDNYRPVRGQGDAKSEVNQVLVSVLTYWASSILP